MKTYKINGKEIELTEHLDMFSSKSSVVDTLAKVIVKQNELIQALGEPVEEKPKWDKNNLKESDEYWYVDSCGQVYCSHGSNPDALNWRLATNNIFETYGEAEDYRRKILGE